MITENKTLPKEWDSTITYSYGATVYFNRVIYKCIVDSSTGQNPALNDDIWEAIDIYKKDTTVMEHGTYAGDDSFWERDHFYIDELGYVYLNNENTGINVKGRDGSTKVSWTDLTAEQREALRGLQGLQGPVGPQGPQGETGTVEWGELTPEQIAQLKGDQGASAYEVWKELPGNEDKTVDDFIAAITGPAATVDSELNANSSNPVANKAIYTYMQKYNALEDRIDALERRLAYIYKGENIQFKFGITADGEFGYVNPENQEVIPFAKSTNVVLHTNLAETAYQVFYAGLGEETNNFEIEDIATLDNLDTHNNTTNLSDSNVMYASGVKLMNMADMFDAKTYIFKDGEFERYKASYNFYGVDYTNKQLISKGTNTIEGCWTGTETGRYAGTINFVVAPVNEGDTINCQYGLINTDNTQLPNIISSGTGRVSFTNASFNEETTFSFNVSINQGAYFASTSNSPQYKIKEIYLS